MSSVKLTKKVTKEVELSNVHIDKIYYERSGPLYISVTDYDGWESELFHDGEFSLTITDDNGKDRVFAEKCVLETHSLESGKDLEGLVLKATIKAPKARIDPERA